MMREEEEEMKNGMEMMRRKLDEWSFEPYYCQEFNKYESPDWRHHLNRDPTCNLKILTGFLDDCNRYKSFDYSIGTKEVGGVKLCSYTELQQIIDFKDKSLFIHNTLAGRLFHGTIIGGEGSRKRSVIVKTWDFLLPFRRGHMHRPHDFCDQVELFTNKKANMHPKLAELRTFCCDTRLAAVYDHTFDEDTTTILSDVLFNDCFGWDDRMKVAIQLADLLVWLHDKDIILGSVTASCILIEDKEMNIKVFDYGPICDHVVSGGIVCCHLGWQAPDPGNMTTKSDVYVFALLLIELITKKECRSSYWCPDYQRKNKNMVDESFKEVDPETGSTITSMIYRSLDFTADKRPTMKYVLDVLTTAAATTTATKMGSKGEKQKREENIEVDTLMA